ncbi:unnamed protein product [Timema podura]|uniref:Uncharacterized protein n=1 Tax=Timema podura TaxID=61482 RepID=A0ABN7P5Q5_TIMPD|nr:unnamed protein product [Timema podura]
MRNTTPTISPKDGCDQPSCGSSNGKNRRGRKKVRRVRSKVFKENYNLKKQLKVLMSKAAKYRKKYQ